MECSTAETPCDTAKASKKEPVRNFMRTGSFLSAAFRTDSERGGMIGCLFDFFFRTARTVRAPLHRSSPLPSCRKCRRAVTLPPSWKNSTGSSGFRISLPSRSVSVGTSFCGRPLAAAASSKAALNKMQKYCIHGQAASGASSAGAAAVMVSDCALMMRWAVSSASSWVRVTRSPTFRITADGLAWALMA